MGQKINPQGFRIGITTDWHSQWFADKKRYGDLLIKDIKIRDSLMEKLRPAGIAKVLIERMINKIVVTVYVARPGVVIGRGGSNLENTKKFLEKLVTLPKQAKVALDLKVEPVKEPDLDAYLVAQSIVDQIIRRIPHRRVVSKTMERVMNAGAKGIKIQLAGRIAGAEISRVEKYHQGTVSVTTLREKISYAQVPALTKSGYVGVKVWINRK